MIYKKISINHLEQWLNALTIAGIVILLIMAFTFQFLFDELPCPLCLLQRIGLLITSAGFILNLRYGLRPSHYALALLGSLFTSFVALRQIALHILPGDVGYGSSILGLHMYTWSFVVSMLIVVFTTIILGFDIQYKKAPAVSTHLKKLSYLLFVFVLALAISNVISTVIECGGSACPDNPTQYVW